MYKFITTKPKPENASKIVETNICIDRNLRQHHQTQHLKQRPQQCQQRHQQHLQHQQSSQRHQQQQLLQHQPQQALQQHRQQQMRNHNNYTLDSSRSIPVQPRHQPIREPAQQSKPCVQPMSQESHTINGHRKVLFTERKHMAHNILQSNEQLHCISKKQPSTKYDLRIPTVDNNIHQNADGRARLKSFDEISETDSGIASNGTISELPTPDCTDPKCIQPSFLSYPNQASDIKCNDDKDDGEICEVGSNNCYNVLNGELTKEEYSNDDESCKNSTLSKFNNSQNSTLTRKAPKTVADFHLTNLTSSKLNLHDMTDFTSNVGNVTQAIQNGNQDDAQFFNTNNKGSICNTQVKFSEEVSRKLTSSLSVQDVKLSRYEKSSHSSLSYLPCPVGVPSATHDRIIKMKERQLQGKLLTTVNDMDRGSPNDRKVIFTVDENEATSETSFSEKLQNIQQNTIPRMKKSLFKTSTNKTSFNTNSCKNNLTSTLQSKKLPAFNRAVSYDYHENSNACYNNGNINKKSFGKTGSFLSLRSCSSVNKENKPTDSVRKQNFGGFFNSLTKLFRRKSKLNESFDQQNSGTAFSLERLDFNNEVATKSKNSKNYSSDSNLNVFQSNGSNQCLNKSFGDEPNSQIIKPSMTSQNVHSLVKNYAGAKSLKESLSEFIKWNSLLTNFTKTEQPNVVLKEECFQQERSNFKQSIRNFMIHAKEAIVNYDSPVKFDETVRSFCCTSFASMIACCCSILDYISLGCERSNLAEMVCNVGKTFYVVISLYPCNKNRLESVAPPSIFFEKIDLLIERLKNLALSVNALKYMGATKLL